LNQSKPRLNFWLIFLLLFAGCFAFFTTVRIFSFYTLPHIQKLLVLGYLFVIYSLVLVRYAQPRLSAVPISKKKIWITVITFLGIAVILFGVLPYHQAPIRTLHNLSLTNVSDEVEIKLNEIKLPGDQFVDFAVQFPESDIVGEQVILKPGQSLTYSREMVGGLELRFLTNLLPSEVKIIWDGETQEVLLNTPGEVVSVKLPGWSLGVPSTIYRLLGIISVIMEVCSLFGLLFCGLFWFWGGKVAKDSAVMPSRISQSLEPYSTPILINLGWLALAVLNQFLPIGRTYVLPFLILAGVTTFVAHILRQHPRWILRIAIPIIILGVLGNLYRFIVPIKELHLTLGILNDNSFSKLAQNTGDSTYFSIGYYRYLRGAILHIPEPLMEELNLYAIRLEEMNIGLHVFNDQYDYNLTTDMANQLLEGYSWQEWPKEGGGISI